MLQQYLPFTVLKQTTIFFISIVRFDALQQYLPFTVLKRFTFSLHRYYMSIFLLQQYLPFTVLKLFAGWKQRSVDIPELQQYLPFTVLKQQHHLK